MHYDTGHRAADPDLRMVTEALEVNLLGAWRTTGALLPLMPSGGCIVNVSSVVWAATLPDGGPTGGFFRDGRPVQW